MLDSNHRFSGYLPDDYHLTASIIGVGAVGSHVAQALYKLPGTKLQLHDPDTVKFHNTTVQAFPPSTVGMPKASAMMYMLQGQMPLTADEAHMGRSNYGIRSVQARYAPWSPSYDHVIDHAVNGTFEDLVIILAVDSIEARRNIMTEIGNTLSRNRTSVHILDFRAAIRLIECHYVYLPEGEGPCQDMEDYLNNLPAPEEAMSEPCDAQMSPAIGYYSAAYALSCVQQILRCDEWKIPKHQMLDIENFMAAGWEGATEPAQVG